MRIGEKLASGEYGQCFEVENRNNEGLRDNTENSEA